MKEYLMIFRNEQKADGEKPSAEQMNAIMQQWQDWITGLAKQGNYSSTNRLIPDEGKTIRPGKVVTDGPYMEAKEMVGGYLIVKANSLDEAVEVGKSCPGLNYGGTVEVRSVMPIEHNSKSENFLAEKVMA